MPTDTTCAVWELDVAQASLEGAGGAIEQHHVEPSYRAALVSTRGDVVTIQLEPGARPSLTRSTRYYLEGQGFFLLCRHEVWPADGAPRVLLTLQAWVRPA